MSLLHVEAHVPFSDLHRLDSIHAILKKIFARMTVASYNLICAIGLNLAFFLRSKKLINQISEKKYIIFRSRKDLVLCLMEVCQRGVVN